MKVEDFLAPGEAVLVRGNYVHFTDRRVFVMYRNSFTQIPYEHISSVEFERKTPFLPIGFGVVVVLVGVLEWVASPSFLRSLGIDPNLALTLIVVAGIFLVGIGLALTRRTLTLRMTSGWRYPLGVTDQKTVEEFLKALGRHFIIE